MAVIKTNPESGNPYREDSTGQFASPNGASSSSQVKDNSPQGYSFAYVDVEDDEAIDKINEIPQLAQHYNSLSPQDKPGFINKVKGLIASKVMRAEMEKDYPKSNLNDFETFHKDCLAQLQAKGTSFTSEKTGKTYTIEELIDAADSMCGSGWSFDYQKYCRIGRDEMKKIPRNSKFDDSTYDRMEDWKDKMEVLTNNCEFPYDVKVYRLLNTDYLVSTFDAGLPQDLPRYDYYGYKKLGGRSGTQNLSASEIAELAQHLTRYIGKAIPSDGSYTSFGMDEASSHMAKHVDEDSQRQVQILYDCPKGTKGYVTDYYGESEGYMSNLTGYFLKDVQTIKRQVHHDANKYGPGGDFEIDTVVLVYGVR